MALLLETVSQDKSMNQLSVGMEDDTIVNMLRSSKLQSLLGVEIESKVDNRTGQRKKNIKNLFSNTFRNDSGNNVHHNIGNNLTRHYRTRTDTKGAPLLRSKSETWRNRRIQMSTPRRVRKLVQWIEKISTTDDDLEKEEQKSKDQTWRPNLDIILNDKQLLRALESYMQRTFCEENILFLKAVRHFVAKAEELQDEEVKSQSSSNVVSPETQNNESKDNEDNNNNNGVNNSNHNIFNTTSIDINVSNNNNNSHHNTNSTDIEEKKVFDNENQKKEINDNTTMSDIDRNIQLIYNEFIAAHATKQVNLSHDALMNTKKSFQEFKTYSIFRKGIIFDQAFEEIQRLIINGTLGGFYDCAEFILVARSRPNISDEEFCKRHSENIKNYQMDSSDEDEIAANSSNDEMTTETTQSKKNSKQSKHSKNNQNRQTDNLIKTQMLTFGQHTTKKKTNSFKTKTQTKSRIDIARSSSSLTHENIAIDDNHSLHTNKSITNIEENKTNDIHNDILYEEPNNKQQKHKTSKSLPFSSRDNNSSQNNDNGNQNNNNDNNVNSNNLSGHNTQNSTSISSILMPPIVVNYNKPNHIKQNNTPTKIANQNQNHSNVSNNHSKPSFESETSVVPLKRPSFKKIIDNQDNIKGRNKQKKNTKIKQSTSLSNLFN